MKRFGKKHAVRFAAVVGLAWFALGACAAYDESAPADEPDDEVIATDESSLVAAECSYDGGCVSWNATTGCTQLMCCTVCGGSWRCSEQPSLGSETCVFFPGVQ